MEVEEAVVQILGQPGYIRFLRREKRTIAHILASRQARSSMERRRERCTVRDIELALLGRHSLTVTDSCRRLSRGIEMLQDIADDLELLNRPKSLG